MKCLNPVAQPHRSDVFCGPKKKLKSPLAKKSQKNSIKMLKKEKKIIIICYLISYVLCLLSIMHRNFYASMEIEQRYCFCAFSHIICTHEYLKQRDIRASSELQLV